MAVFKNFLVVFVLMHWGACLWYFASSMSDDSEPNWVTTLFNDEDGTITAQKHHSELYLCALFNSVSILYGGTCADGFSPQSQWEYGFAVVLQSVGAACYAVALGGVCGYISNKDPATQQFQACMVSRKLIRP
jgi:voltage-gated potassium channel